MLPAALNRDLHIVWSANPALSEILADPDMVRRVLINLLENAVKFTPAEGKIKVGAKSRRGLVEFSVSDTGAGIPDVDHERIFEKFARLASKEGPRGLGLGLAYCKLAVLGHGGKIWVESQPGQGATFKFTIPQAN